MPKQPDSGSSPSQSDLPNGVPLSEELVMMMEQEKPELELVHERKLSWAEVFDLAFDKEQVEEFKEQG